jgi:hypothetical protein
MQMMFLCVDFDQVQRPTRMLYQCDTIIENTKLENGKDQKLRMCDQVKTK